MSHLDWLGRELTQVWAQAQENHARYSRTGDDESDIRFFALGLSGEAGELANFVKKRWRDGVPYDAQIKAEVADVCAYAFMLASAFNLSPLGLIREIARKQSLFLAKMHDRDICKGSADSHSNSEAEQSDAGAPVPAADAGTRHQLPARSGDRPDKEA